jgi:hypothetical protein
MEVDIVVRSGESGTPRKPSVEGAGDVVDAVSVLTDPQKAGIIVSLERTPAAFTFIR